MEQNRPDPGYRAATVGGGIAGAIGAAAAFVLALPFYPRGDDDAWAELGWAIVVLIACSSVGIAAGAGGIFRALRRQGMSDPGLTALVFIPTAALLIFGGPLVFAAPAAARWMALGFRQWWDARAARRDVAPVQERAAGRPQRLVLWAVLTLLGMSLVTSMLNASLGRQVGGAAKVWAVCALVPVVLLPIIWRAVPRVAVAACLVAALLIAAAMTRTVTAELHPTPARLDEIAAEMEPPRGQRVVSRTSALAERYPAVGGDPQPVEIIQTAPTGEARSPLPPALTPDAAGRLEVNAPAVPHTVAPSGSAAASDWQRALLDDGWTEDWPNSERADPMDWVPSPASEFLAQHGGPVLAKGLWLRAVVVPHGDGALVVLSTRP